MGIVKLLKKGFDFLKDPDTDIRVRMLFLLEYSALAASVFGSIAMLNLATSVLMIIPNFFRLYLLHLAFIFHM